MELEKFIEIEKKILDIVLNNSKANKDVIYSQIQNSEINRESTKYYNLTFFKVDETVKKLPFEGKKKVIFEILVYDDNKKMPMDVLLYAEKGMITELEFYNSDLSSINYDLPLNNILIQVNEL